MMDLPPPTLPNTSADKPKRVDVSALHSYKPKPRAKVVASTLPTDWPGIMRDISTYPFREWGWMSLLSAALISLLVSSLWRFAAGFCFLGCLAVILQSIFNSTLRHKSAMPEVMEIADDAAEHLHSAAHAMLLLLMSYWPVAAVVIYQSSSSPYLYPLIIPLLGYCQVYLSLSFIGWNLTGNISECMPHRVWSLMWRLGKDCVPLAATSMGLTLLPALGTWLLFALFKQYHWGVLAAAYGLVIMAFLAAQARLAGLFYLRHFESCDDHAYE